MPKPVCILLVIAFSLALASCGSTRSGGDIVDDCAHQTFCGDGQRR
jgi:hypothetical protein